MAGKDKKGKSKQKKGKADEPVGAKALSGELEHIQGKVFDAVDFDRYITCRGTLIQVYNPNEDTRRPAYWEYEDEENLGTTFVPKYHEVRVVKAYVSFKRPASEASP